MSELTGFLLARVAEDEATGWDWENDPETRLPRFWMPRLSAECAAKRAIVELHQPLEGLNPPVEFICETCGSGEPYEYPTEWPCRTLRLLALPYADHPDYREEWRA